jgi:hypothetical protein
MTDIKFVEREFIDEFIVEYDTSGEYDYTIIFDDYFEEFIQKSSNIYLEKILKYYYTKNQIKKFKKILSDDDDIKVIASIQLYTKLYKAIEKSFEENYLSDNDTDIE